jgi:hypothetical protein
MLGTMERGDPISYRVLEPGVAAISADGKRVGTVEHVLADENADIFDGLVIKLDHGGHRFVDAPEVADLHTRAVTLAIDAAAVERLPRPGSGPAVMEHHGAEDSEGPLQHKLRRAWELISGKV